MVEGYMARQEQLVQSLSSVVAMQKAALEALGEGDGGDDDGEARHAAHDEADEALRVQEAEFARDIDRRAMREERSAGGGGDEEEGRGFMAVKPWLGAIHPPTGYTRPPAGHDAPPSARLTLEHVYGYRARTVRNNIALADRRVVYPAAAVGIVHDPETNTQTFYQGHTDDILCLDFHRETRRVATGQIGREASVHVWDVTAPDRAGRELKGHARGVACVGFSGNGALVASVGLDDNHSVIVHNTSSGAAEAREKGDTNRIYELVWNTTAGADPNAEFVTVGLQHVYFWKVAGRSLSKNRGTLGKSGEMQAFLSVVCTTDLVLVATKSGAVYAFKGGKMASSIPAHSGMCTTLAYTTLEDGGPRVITGGADGIVNVWDAATLGSKAPRKVDTFDFSKIDPSATGKNAVASVWAEGRAKGRMVVGCATDTIYSVDLGSKRTSVVTTAHYGDLGSAEQYGEMWALAASSRTDRVLSGAEDKTVRLWDVARRVQLARCEMPQKVKSLAWHPSDHFAAVGLADGTVAIVSASGEGLTIEASLRKTKDRIEAMSFSPDGTMLITTTGAKDVRSGAFRLQLFQVGEDGSSLSLLKESNPMSAVFMHVDWSEDGRFVQADTRAYELLYFSVPDLKQYTRSSELKDVKWATQTCILGFSVTGIWAAGKDGSDVNNVRRSYSGRMLAAGEDSGLVRVYKYPTYGGGISGGGKIGPQAGSITGKGHSEHVTQVAWQRDDRRLFSAGGADNCLFQWKVEGGA